MAEPVVGTAEDLRGVDGPLRGQRHLRHALDLVKTHHRESLPPELLGLLWASSERDRAPVFTIVGEWTRHWWSLRSPGAGSGARAGIAGCSASVDLVRDEVVALVDLSAGVLPKRASEPRKNQRAPQSLHPLRTPRHQGSPQMLRASPAVGGSVQMG
jgi:hypothetical protein